MCTLPPCLTPGFSGLTAPGQPAPLPLLQPLPALPCCRVLLAFSLTAPASTLLTLLVLSALPAFASPTAVSLALLFSGGTFLYAATMHILPEVLGVGQTTVSQLAAVAVGGLLPVALSWGHSH